MTGFGAGGKRSKVIRHGRMPVAKTDVQRYFIMRMPNIARWRRFRRNVAPRKTNVGDRRPNFGRRSRWYLPAVAASATPAAATTATTATTIAATAAASTTAATAATTTTTTTTTTIASSSSSSSSRLPSNKGVNFSRHQFRLLEHGATWALHLVDALARDKCCQAIRKAQDRVGAAASTTAATAATTTTTTTTIAATATATTATRSLFLGLVDLDGPAVKLLTVHLGNCFVGRIGLGEGDEPESS